MTKRIVAAACILVTFLGGCQSDPTIAGKVIEGNMSFVGAVDDRDPRLEGPGLEGATITGIASAGPSEGATLGSITTDKKGEFKLPVRIQRALIYPIEFTASHPGYLDARQTMSSPGEGRKLLIMMRPRASGGGAAGAAGGGGG